MPPQPVTDALGLAEDAILEALRALEPIGAADWDPGPADINRRLALPPTDPAYLSRYFLAHHQDNGGRRAMYLQSDGWEGLVTIRVRSRDRELARAGLGLVVAAMADLPQPNGYTLQAAWTRPLTLPATDPHTFTFAGIWRVTIRRVPAQP